MVKRSGAQQKAKGQQIRAWHLNRRSGTDLSGIAKEINPQVRGWINYYGAFYRSELSFLALRIDQHLGVRDDSLTYDHFFETVAEPHGVSDRSEWESSRRSQ